MGRRKRTFRIELLIFFIAMSLTAALPLSAQGGAPFFRWRNPTPLHMGERGQIILELVNWNPQRTAPTGIFQGMAPLYAILGESPPQRNAEGIYLYTLSLIPLEERNIVITPFTHQHGDLTLNIPRISVSVLPKRTLQQAPGADEISDETLLDGKHLAAQGDIPPFPETRVSPMPFLQGDYDRIIDSVRSLWDEKLLAQALAELRRNERDSLVGPYLAPLRREIEQILGFGFTENERWRPLGIPLLSYVFFLSAIVFVVVFLFILGPRQKTILRTKSRKVLTLHFRKSYVLLMTSVLLIGLVLMFLEERFGNLPAGRFRSPGRTAVLRETQGYRVPDFRGMVNDLFNEGQPVIVIDYGSDQRFDWRYVEAPDGRSGWVPRETVITY